MKVLLAVILVIALAAIAIAAPVNDTTPSTKKGPQFVSSFDEIVVESSLTVRGKNNQGRQGKSLVVTTPKSTTAAADYTTTAKSS